MDIFPGEWVGSYHEFEFEKKLSIGNLVKVVVDSQFDDTQERRIDQIGRVIEITSCDEWRYKVRFYNGSNWFKRYHLEAI